MSHDLTGAAGCTVHGDIVYSRCTVQTTVYTYCFTVLITLRFKSFACS